MAGAVAESRWPPRSPHEALLSSPSGRNRVRHFHNRTSPTPSPLKKSATTPNLRHLQRKPLAPAALEEDEEDEETLQLRLDAIEARLRLKKLQQKKAKAVSAASDVENEKPVDNRSKSFSALQIPVSPSRNRIVTEEKRSPGRILLGIDKGLKGRNVSLKRPADRNAAADDPFTSKPTPSTARASTLSKSAASSFQEQPRKPQSFSDRIAESRRQDNELNDRVKRVRKERSTGFGIQRDEIERLKNVAESQPLASTLSEVSSSAGEFSREELLKALHKPNGGLSRSKSTTVKSSQPRVREVHTPHRPAFDTRSTHSSKPKCTPSELPLPGSSASDQPPPSTDKAPFTDAPNEPSDSLFEPFSTLHLSKRLLPNPFLTRTFAARPVLTIPSLLSSIKSPSYTLPPDLDGDFIILAIIASKSSPISHRDAHRSTSSSTTSTAEAAESETNARGKYMVLTLTDLKWSLDLYLFTTAYTRFWKLTPGTLIAILNPSIMPPPAGKQDTGRFSLVLNSSDDTVLEIGTSRDLGWCKSVKRDGKPCGAWVDKRHTSVCEFHVDRVVERTRAARMEVNGISAPYGPKGRGGSRTGFWGGSKRRKDDGLLPAGGAQYDRGLGTQYFVAPGSSGRSAARLLDAEGGGMEWRENREERARKRMAAQEKEREIARRLGEGGNGMAAEYLRRKCDSVGEGSRGQQVSAEAVDARMMGLGSNKAVEVQLSPVKKRKAVGVGLGNRAEEGEMGTEKKRKKARFVTGEGIKVAGRESGGGDVWLDAANERDDDELVIV